MGGLPVDERVRGRHLANHGDCDLPTRRHAQVSRPVLTQGRIMSSINTISPDKLAHLIGRPDCPSLVDIQIDEAFPADPRLIPGAVRRSFRTVSDWAPEFAGRSVVVICQK